MPEGLRVLGNKPMPSIHICDLSIGEEFLDRRDGLVRDISGFGASNKERGPLVLLAVCFGEGEICHVIERVTNDRQWQAELEGIILFRADEVG